MIAIDLGSNTLRIVKFDCETLKKTDEFEKTVRTADKLYLTGIISKEATQRIIDAIIEAKEKIDFDDDIEAVATAAFRKAENAKSVIEEIKTKTGIEFKIISSDEEAVFTVYAVKHRLIQLGKKAEKFLVADIGGASTELIMYHKEGVVTESFDIGIVTTAQQYKSKESMLIGIRRKISSMRIFIDDIYELFGIPKEFVATGGTPTTLAALKLGLTYDTYDPEKINGTVLYPVDLDEALRKLESLSFKKREEIVGEGRADLITAGIHILKELLKVSGFDEVTVCDDGLREGVALINCQKKLG
ncbi:phosphatase [Nitrosophilus alvini]|uniref:Ppx/GppA phosphatase family protein n=1 Tax=Nitrosophilus alvini TaxID=2714855 RepID=UPI00190B838F|nr:phosphatase [Nitrosophilus alvini]